MQHFRSSLPSLATLILVLQLCSIEARAQWSTDPTINNPICITAHQQQAPRVVTDGNGGAIITWWDLDLTTSNYDIYAQRISGSGAIQWTVNGIAVCTNPALQHVPEMISDGNGGAIIAWQDNRSGRADIYAQRINSNGLIQWGADGIPVCAESLDQTSPQLVTDGSGGAIITWRDLRNGTSYMPYAQRINANGAAQWTLNGVLLSTAGTAEGLVIISDGSGGAIIAWHSYSGNFDIIAQQISATGSIGWGNNGAVICALTSDQLRPQLASNDNHGAIIVWEDYRNVTYSNLYAQQINASGVAQWTLNGVAIAPNTLSQIRHKLLRDGSSGIIVAWQYSSGALANTIYAQRLNSSGGRLWASDGVSIGGAGDSRFPDIATDGGTGAIITWYDFRGSGNGDVFAQRINQTGVVQWIANGVGVCRDPSGQALPRLAADGIGGAIMAWEDSRNSVTNPSDIYAQRINANGTLGGATGVHDDHPSVPTAFVLKQNYPNPFNPSTVIAYDLPTSSNVTLSVFDMLGREVRSLVHGFHAAGSYTVTFESTGLASGMYAYRITAGEFVQTRTLVLLR